MFVKVGINYIPVDNIVRIEYRTLHYHSTISNYVRAYDGTETWRNDPFVDSVHMTEEEFQEFLKQIELDTNYKKAVTKFLAPEGT